MAEEWGCYEWLIAGDVPAVKEKLLIVCGFGKNDREEGGRKEEEGEGFNIPSPSLYCFSKECSFSNRIF
jgi:hypothetical protein